MTTKTPSCRSGHRESISITEDLGESWHDCIACRSKSPLPPFAKGGQGGFLLEPTASWHDSLRSETFETVYASPGKGLEKPG